MWGVVYLALLAAAGYAAVKLCSPVHSRLQNVGLSACLGPGLVGFVLLFLSMLGLRPSRVEVLSLAIPIYLVARFSGSSQWTVEQPAKRKTSFSAAICIGLCFIAILYPVVSIAADSLYHSVTEWDAFAIWQLKGKLLAVYPLMPKPGYFSDLNLSYSHLRYPLLWPMISAGMHAVTGALDGAGKYPAILFAFGLPTVLYALLRETRSRAVSLAVIALLLNVIPMYRYAGCGTADMALTAFYGCSVVCLYRWQQRGFSGDMVLAALFTAMMPWTKNEGVPLAMINAIAIALFAPMPWSKAIGKAIAFSAIVAVLYAPWMAFVHGVPSTDEDYIHRLRPGQIIENLDRLPTILVAFWREITFTPDPEHHKIVAEWGFFWAIVGLLSIFQWRRFKERRVCLLATLLILHFIAYIPPFLVVGDQWKLTELLDVTTDRLVLHMAPVAALLIGLLWPIWAEEPLLNNRNSANDGEPAVNAVSTD